ncbi:YbhB/YbcL family Raf kinase inhibitor-like protein [Martelella soudanensis]|uniref:YbhB/YbcL family Raf kinase inhibitor-like protein n=1 Tax=unclassified Martelella TaxID=2629616 RepID=UPI0015DFD6CE|nr:MULTISPECIES: YbhB/YbcL family Raf kinase inhibitor-like protein [unclassified Martelella]
MNSLRNRKTLRSDGSRAFIVLAAIAVLPASALAMELTSSSFDDGGAVPLRHALRGSGCLGQNVSPALEWNDAPPETKSFAVTMFDPDAPTGSGWWHWVLVNIPADVTALAEGARPGKAFATRTDFGMAGYGGPCPPAGAAPHRYVITVYALDVDSLPLDAMSSGAMAGYMINSHALARARITGLFGR